MTRNRLSSETLFNFTDKLEHLIDNLHHGIHCAYQYEKLPKRNNGYYVHMACFCDIPLSMTDEHFDWYGRYGIGINRSYLRGLGVRPVWYLTSENPIIGTIISECTNNKPNKQLLPYMKQFMGYQDYKIDPSDENSKSISKRKKFYDEREWRYVPTDSTLLPAIGKSRSHLYELVSGIKPLRMKLELDNIEFIIVAKDGDLSILLDELKKLAKKYKYSYEKLVSRIITARQIERDF